MPQTWPVTCGHESGTETQKLIEWKRDSDESQMDKCESDGGVCGYVRTKFVFLYTAM